MSVEEVVASCKGLSVAELAFRSYKSVDLQLRPVYYRFPDRDRAHVFLSMLAYYAEWRMRGRPAPILFDEPDRQSAARMRRSAVALADGKICGHGIPHDASCIVLYIANFVTSIRLKPYESGGNQGTP